ncbi:ABC transporter permease subunit [Streptomyces turgidiscabies]|uniref:Putative membrane protein n=1 Tax=Streptomyces turgidiscabies (strain Car8) TaxID=698760 RepID=L7EWV2_STRT8|nr:MULTISPECIES: ABC transporter permease subunit [Streptomyces]ELP63359.1 putative membrane protein [Streptomyces turgidiscabies Car8]MDX3495621.1 ABC transporter permease subunit [Streptomyces turgidiscabies]GAQ70311.1 ABC-2 family transporter protein [Streptomyces turgidiscabies]
MSTPQQPPTQALQPQSAPNWQAAPGTSYAPYTSPIPVTRTHLGHALASEWTKIKSVRSTIWTLGVFLLLVVGIGLLVAAQTTDEDFGKVPYTIPAFFGLILGQICLITLGVLVVSSEYGTGMIRTTFTASPQRHRVLAAKLIIFFTVAFVVSAFAIGFIGLVTESMHSDGEGAAWGGTVVKGALYVSLLGVLALAVGSMLRHSAGAITAMLGLVLVPAILPAFLMLSESMRTIGEKMVDYNAPNALAKIFGIGEGDGGTGGGAQLGLLAGVTAAAIVGAFVLLDRRDV